MPIFVTVPDGMRTRIMDFRAERQQIADSLHGRGQDIPDHLQLYQRAGFGVYRASVPRAASLR